MFVPPGLGSQEIRFARELRHSHERGNSHDITEIKTKPRHAIGSGFGAETTAAGVIRGIDLSGKIVIVSGGRA